jgi:hypothetical protein|tara:strand:- start:252 stop:368 length:117 start_codon:yes stop_codon:yes gene_type:complete
MKTDYTIEWLDFHLSEIRKRIKETREKLNREKDKRGSK